MTLSPIPVVDKAAFNAAALEAAAVVRNAVVSCAADGGLLDVLGAPHSLADIADLVGVDPAKSDAARAVLELAVAEGVLTAFGPGDARRYRRTRQMFRRHVPDLAILSGWQDAEHCERVWRSQRAFLGTDLAFLRVPGSWATYDARNVAAWRRNFANLLNNAAREFVISGVARPAGRFLDLGSGMGHAAVSLAKRCGGDCEITCVDKSADYLAMIPQSEFPPTTRVTTRLGDMTEMVRGQDTASVDGVLICGALNYVNDVPGLFTEVHRILRPGGRLGVSAYVRSTGYSDEWVQRWMFAINNEPVTVPGVEEFASWLEASSFTVVDDLHRGSQYSSILSAVPAARVAW